IRGCVAHVPHKFRLHLLMAILTLSLAELMFFVLYSLPLSQHWPEKEMMCMLGATAIVAPQSALLYLTPAALDLLLLLLQRPKGLLGSPQQSATRQQQHQHQQQQQQQVATSRNADIEEYPMPTWNVWQQRDRSHYGQAFKIKNFTWPSRGTRALD
ncbi:unnamed protein product, partial [Polarella glacialis]